MFLLRRKLRTIEVEKFGPVQPDPLSTVVEN
jgi:hypothetical protein